MSWLLWMLIGLGAGLIALGLYYFNATRRAEHTPFPLDDALRGTHGSDPLDDPLVQSPSTPSKTPSHEPRMEPKLDARSEPRLKTSAEFDELGVGPVRLRPQDEAAAARLAVGRQRRTPRFSYKNSDDAPRPTEVRREPHFDTVIGLDRTEQPTSTVQDANALTSAITPQTLANQARQPSHTAPAPQPASPPNQASALEEDTTQNTKSATPDVIPLYLVARKPGGFAGSTLQPLFARLGFEFGEMSVYHYADANGHILFSLMNGVAPGTFDPSTLPEQSTPALALFLRLPIARQPNLVLEQFLDLAYHMADALDASVLDDRREELNTESVDRMRAIFIDD
ncbi:MAG TPA: hypothetical protein ENO09_06200 [bacterium]|nr:hypothetical protein [bacterium]